VGLDAAEVEFVATGELHPLALMQVVVETDGAMVGGTWTPAWAPLWRRALAFNDPDHGEGV
jgi:hypothetical protein